MRAQYDLAANAMYVLLLEEPVAATVELEAGTLIDLSATRRVRGIEIINPRRPWLPAVLRRFRDQISEPDRALLLALYGGPDVEEGLAIVRPTVETTVTEPVPA